MRNSSTMIGPGLIPSLGYSQLWNFHTHSQVPQCEYPVCRMRVILSNYGGFQGSPRTCLAVWELLELIPQCSRA